MRDPNRIDSFLEKLKEIWKANPDLRFTQLILNVFDSPASYYIEDEYAIEILKRTYFGA